VALAVWAAPRTTHDLDIVVDMPEELVADFCSRFPEERFSIDSLAMRDAFARRDELGLGLYSFTDMETGFKVDLFPLRQNDPAQQAALQRRVVAKIMGGLQAVVYAPDDLLIQKLRWYADSDSERQFRDCANLLVVDLQRPTPLIDWNYIEEWARQLGPNVQQAWVRVRDAAKQMSTGQG
jgi:hypothetical protein